MLITSRLSTKGQITIPKQIRDDLDLKKSDQLAFAVVDNYLIVKPVKDFLEFGGSVDSVDQPEDFEKIRKKVMRRVSKDIAEK